MRVRLVGQKSDQSRREKKTRARLIGREKRPTRSERTALVNSRFFALFFYS